MSCLWAVLLSWGVLALVVPTTSAQTTASSPIHIATDSGEAGQVLRILALRQAGRAIPDVEWQKLFATTPYRRLKERERTIGEQFHVPALAFSDADFRQFVLSDRLLRRAPQLRQTLARWMRADLERSAERILKYLPDGARIHVTVYPIIKPRGNSFVWDLSGDPAIFLYLEPDVSRDKFENTVAHEMHHIGLGSLGPVYTQTIAALPEPARTVAGEMAAFGEGLAMLAAAGGPDIDPHAASAPAEHHRWEEELASFDTDLPAVNRFFLDVLNGKLTDPDSIEAKGSSFFGSHQGPWYTVGYRMAVMVERRFGRSALIRTMLDYRCLLALYNRAARERNAADGQVALPLWSASVLSRVNAGTCGVATTDPG